MPLYVYEEVLADDTGGEVFEFLQPLSAAAYTAHPDTGVPVRRLLGVPNAPKTWTDSQGKAKTSDGNLEAWIVKDGQGERLDNRTLATKMKNPYLSIVRRGDEFLFVINKPDGKPEDAQIGLTKVIKNLPKSFHLMLYGYGSSENNWNSARVVVAK